MPVISGRNGLILKMKAITIGLQNNCVTATMKQPITKAANLKLGNINGSYLKITSHAFTVFIKTVETISLLIYYVIIFLLDLNVFISPK